MIEPRPPIFIEESGDVESYDALSQAELDVEAVDIRNKMFQFFDSEGVVLEPNVVASAGQSGFLRRFLSPQVERVKLVAPDDAERRPELLKAILRDFLSRVGTKAAGMSDEELARAGLDELIEAMTRYEGRTR